MTKQNISIFQRPIWVALFGFTAAFVWGWAYPLIKLGFAEFAITSCACLAEPFHWNYLLAGTLSALGIYIINKGKK